MGQKILQNSFLGGIVSPALLGRVDLATYQQGAYELTNFLVNPQGSITTRGGLRYVCPVKEHGKKVRLIPFRFSSEQTLVLVFGDKWMRIVTEGKVLMKGSAPFELSTPYTETEIFELDYTQNADIITLTNPNHPPMELRRYGATDWRLVSCQFAPSITPPSSVSGSAIYPDKTEEKDKGTIVARYVVTSVDAEGKESVASAPFTINCNYYVTGGRVELAWSPVTGAHYYRIYREVSGIYGFLGQTESTEIIDEGDNPDTTYTPPRYEVAFQNKSGIKEVIVENGGSGYLSSVTDAPVTSSTTLAMPWGFVLDTLTNENALGLILGVVLPISATAEFCFELIDKAGQQIAISDPISLKRVYYKDGGEHASTQQIYVPAVTSADALFIRFSKLSGSASNASVRILGIKYETRKGTTVYAPSQLEWNRFETSRTLNFSYKDPDHGGSIGQTHEFSVTYPSWYVAMRNDANGYGDFASVRQTFPALFSELAPSCYAKAYTQEGCPVAEWLREVNVSLKTENAQDVELVVSDPTGTGAQLLPIIEDGKITGVTVISSGENYTNPSITVKASQGSGARLRAVLYNAGDYDYPSANTQYDQRRVFAGTYAHPVKVLMTNAGQQDLMMYHLPTMADDRISLEAVTADADRIIHAVSLDSLILFTRSAELRVFTQNSDALSPDSVAVRPQSYVGSNNVQPLICNSNVLYAASRGGHLRSLNFSYAAQGYASGDLSLVCPHLFDSKDINDLALSKAPVQVAWAVSSDGHLLALTYYPEQEVAAWSLLETSGEFESCCVVSEGTEDHLYVVVKRSVNGNERRYIERLEYYNVPKSAEDFRQLDSFIDAVWTKSNAAGETTLTGLEHLEGMEVTAVCDGVEYGGLRVQGGRVTVPTGAFSRAMVGLPYVCRITTVPLAAAAGTSSLQGHVKNPSRVYLRCRHDGDLFVGDAQSQELWPVKRDDLSFKKGPAGSQVTSVNITGAWAQSGQVTIEHRNALPLEINAIVGEYSIEGVKG